MLLFLIQFFISFSFALTFTIDHPQKGLLAQGEVLLSEPSNVGVVTMSFLEARGIAYDGSELGFSSIDGLEQRLDILSKSEMKAYGWCFSVNGEVVETLAHQTELDASSEVRWFYAFAHYQEGVWISQCEEE